MQKKLLSAGAIIFFVVISLFIITPIVLLVYLSPLSTLFSLSSAKVATGIVIDCETQQPIANAQVLIAGSGWGFSNGKLIWDKSYSSLTLSNMEGVFSLEYKIGTTLVTSKDGYLAATNYVKNGESVAVGLRKKIAGGDEDEITYNCKFSSECLMTRQEGDSVISWNECVDPRE